MERRRKTEEVNAPPQASLPQQETRRTFSPASKGTSIAYILVVQAFAVVCFLAAWPSVQIASDSRSLTYSRADSTGVDVFDSKRRVRRTESRFLSSMKCPSAVSPAKNYVESFDEYIKPVERRASNLQEYLQTYRTKEFDAWLRTYEQVLEGMRHWKATHIVPNVKSGEKIYETASGMGLNLVMTLEILKEHGINDVTVYGNEYLSASVELGNQVLDALLPESGNHRGVVCAADSTNLEHVPSDSFDFVYTGYISDLVDPLEFNLTEKENEQRYKDLCKSTSLFQHGQDWKLETLLDIAQERQHEWYRKWVNEMIRIAKPGKVIVIEQQRLSECGPHRPDFLGLSREWWPKAIKKYGWDIDPTSLEFEDDTLFYGRYHLMMRKNP